MNRVAQFERISFARFEEDWKTTFGQPQKNIQQIYEGLSYPARATAGSAGYDFFSPLPVSLSPGESITIPTGFRVRIEDGWFLAIFPRSGLGFRYRLQMNNTVGIIDRDYYDADNEGHIFIKMTNDSKDGKTVSIQAGQGYAQGVFLPYGITVNDEATANRHGGLGSTTN